MSTTDIPVQQLIINKLTKEQYEDIATPSDTELYFIPEEPASTTNLGPVKVDGVTITATSDGTISSIPTVATSVIDQNNTSTAIKTWTGTRAQYDAIVTKNDDTIYNITDDNSIGYLVFDDTLNSTSVNAVQNKTLYAIIGDIETLINAL